MTTFYDQDTDTTVSNDHSTQRERRRLTHDIDRGIIEEQRQTIALMQARIESMARMLDNYGRMLG